MADRDWSRTRGWETFRAACRAMGVAGERGVLALDLDSRRRFEAEWSRRMYEAAEDVAPPPSTQPPSATTRQQQVAALYREGLNDHEIAARLGITQARVQQIRGGSLKLSPHGRRTPQKRLQRLHADGHTDASIARALGYHIQHIGEMRRALGLPANLTMRPRDPDHDEKAARIRALYLEDGLTYVAIRQRLGVSPRTIARALRDSPSIQAA